MSAGAPQSVRGAAAGRRPLRRAAATRRTAAAACLLAAAFGRPAAAQPQRECAPAERVRSVTFEGATIGAPLLREAIVTQRPGFFARLVRLGRFPCLDAAVLDDDALRLAVLHRQRGWFRATATVVRDARPDGVRLRFVVTPGPRATVAEVTVEGVPPPPPGRSDAAAPVRALADAPLDRVELARAVERTLGRLRDRGYARARLDEQTVRIDSLAATGSVTVVIAPGARLRLGEVRVEREGINGDPPSYGAAAIRRLARLEAGAGYSAADIERAQDALYRTDAFRLVLVDTAPAAASDSLIDLEVTVAEARTRSARVGVGWGTLECGRVQGRLTDRSFLGLGRNVELVARGSRVGLGAPLGFAPALCPQFLRDDPFSRDLNYYVGASLANSTFFGRDVAPTLSVYSERRGEPYAFSRETDVGVSAALSRALGTRTVATSTVGYETGRTVTSPVIGCLRFGFCELAEFALLAPGNSIRALEFSLVHDRTGGAFDPRDGGRIRLDLRSGITRFSSLAGVGFSPSEWAFYRPSFDLAGYMRLGGGVLAGRVQWTRVFAPNAPTIDGTPFLPPQERLFSGGQNSVRGYQQNLLGPVVYTVDRRGVDSVPVGGSYAFVVRPDAPVVAAAPEGGTGSAVATLEWRRRFRWPTTDVQWAAFVDVGAVWLEQRLLPRNLDWRATPGIGIRLDTPLGPFRVDVGYNPRQRETGKAFLVDSLGAVGGGDDLFRVGCVSLDGTVPVEEQFRQVTCPRAFTPRAGRSLLSRLVFHFGLGQAF